MLTDLEIRSAKPRAKTYRLSDGKGLCLEVKPNGAKKWRYRYRISGKANMFTIGPYPESGLKRARRELEQARELVRKGIHPSHYRHTAREENIKASANTFKTVATEWVEQNRSHWSAYYLKQVQRGMRRDVYPRIGRLPIDSITAAQVLEILKAVEKRGAETVAILIRQWCSAVFRYAVATLRADSDPAAALKGSIKRPRVRHNKPLQREEIPAFLESLEQYGGYRTTQIALELLLLLFVRTVELRKAEWPELNLDERIWRIPAQRMKMREEHLVPLSREAIELLKQLRSLTGSQLYLFPNHRRPKDCMTPTTLNRALERMGYGGSFSAHGFRATASTILNELGYRSEVIERQLAHRERNQSRAAYNRAQYLEERREMMNDWSRLITQLSKGDSVVIGRFKPQTRSNRA